MAEVGSVSHRIRLNDAVFRQGGEFIIRHVEDTFVDFGVVLAQLRARPCNPSRRRFEFRYDARHHQFTFLGIGHSGDVVAGRIVRVVNDIGSGIDAAEGDVGAHQLVFDLFEVAGTDPVANQGLEFIGSGDSLTGDPIAFVFRKFRTQIGRAHV